MTTGELQQQLFKAIKIKMGESSTAVEEILTLLGISNDSTYRRMREDKTLTIERSKRKRKGPVFPHHPAKNNCPERCSERIANPDIQFCVKL